MSAQPEPSELQDLYAFDLGQHHVQLRASRTGTLSLWLDGCQRKARDPGPDGVYLWTNVELPFEDHHLVEVRLQHDGLRVTVNGHLQAHLQHPATGLIGA